MRKGRFLKYLLAMVMAVSTAGSAVAQEERTIRYGLGTEGNALIFKVLDGSSPSGVTLTSSNFNKGEFYESLTEKAPGWYVNVGETGTINFQNFYYEVSSIGVRRNISGTVLERAVDTELNISMYPIMGAVPSVVFDNKVDWSEPACTDVPIKINGSKSTMSGISQLDVSVPASHWEGIVYVTNRNTYVREVEIKYYLPEIRVGFTNGNKGYDISVGDNNAQIKGFISAHPGAFVGSDGNLAQGVSFEYESSDPSVVSVTTSGNVGTLVAHKEGDVTITAKLMNAGQVVNTYSYPLHSFAAGEGLTWNRYGTLYKSSSSNNNSYTFGGANPIQGIDWSSSNILKTQTTIWENESNTQTQGQYKQIVCLEAPAPTSKNWRAAVQKLSCEILVPKYTAVESTLKFGANTTLGNESKSNVTYGYEFVDLGIKTDANTSFATASANADARIAQISWNTNSTSEQATSVGSYRTNGTNGITYLRNGANEYRKYNIITAWNNGEGYVGDHYTAGSYWKYDNSKNANSYTETRFFAAMAFLQNQVNYSATASFGYQDIPTYRYYAFVDFYANYETENNYLGQEILFVDGKNKTKNLNAGNVSFVPNRTGYKLLGWSTDKDAKTAEYPVNGEFSPYDKENGGGKGPVTLYAVWQAKRYTVTLKSQNDTEDKTFTVTYGQKMSNVWSQSKTGYTLRGYWTEPGYTQKTATAEATDDGEQYYVGNVTERIWDRTEDLTLYGHWTANTYTLTFNNNGGLAGPDPRTVTITFDGLLPQYQTSDAPTKTGYTFAGYYWDHKSDAEGDVQYYNSDMSTDKVWNATGNITFNAHWIPKTTLVTYDVQGGTDWAATTQSVTYGEPMPNVTAPQRSGYTFAGYYDQPNGQGKKYYDFRWGNVESVTSWDKDVVEATLYAYWEPRGYTVVFKYPNDNIQDKTVTGYLTNRSNNSSLKNLVIPTPPNDGIDYQFAGWAGNNGSGSIAYNAEGEAIAGFYWKKNSEGNLVWKGGNDETVYLYPQWIKDFVSVDVKVIRDNNYENTTYNHRYVGVSVSGITDIRNYTGSFSGYITVDGVNFLSYIKNGNQDELKSASSFETAPIWIFEKVGDEYVIYTNVLENGNKVPYYLACKIGGQGESIYASIAVQKQKPDRNFVLTDEGWLCFSGYYDRILYMKENDLFWNYQNTGNNPQYKPIMIIAASSSTTTYGNLNAKTVIKAIKKKLTSPEYAYNVGKANVDIKDADLCKGLLYVDMGGAAKVMETTAGELRNFKDEVSDNCLFFMPKTYNNTLGTNVVTNMGDKYVSADDLVITDKVPFSSPYTFSTGSHIASYNRVTSDKWGSMCLPFPVKRSGSDMKFYNLYGSDDIRLAFKSDDGTNDIPANKPIACNGSGNFTLTSNSNAVVPADNDSREYNEVVTAISCENIRELVEDGKQMTTENKPWNFKGVRFDSYVYGTEYTETLPNRAKKSLVYYFSKDKFTYVNSKGRVKFAPFRAYLQAPEGSSAKTFSLLVFDEDGATDITEIIDGNAGVANGKIYDLLGRRVKTPLKGHIYIVDGKKKQY